MKRRDYIALAVAGAALLVMLDWCIAPSEAQEQLAVIVNPANPTTSLSAGDLHRIYMGDKASWPNGKHIFLIMAAPGSAERGLFLKTVYKMSEAEYAKYFLQASFTGAVSAPPKEAASSAEVKQLVAANPAAIGYVKTQDADDSVKVLLKLP